MLAKREIDSEIAGEDEDLDDYGDGDDEEERLKSLALDHVATAAMYRQVWSEGLEEWRWRTGFRDCMVWVRLST